MPKTIILSNGKEAVVDDDLYPALINWKWNYRKGYACHKTTHSGRTISMYMHRFIVSCPRGFVVDHIDGNPLNNCRSNLRIVKNSENSQNCYREKTKYKGVNYAVKKRKFAARICRNRQQIFIGYFDTPAEAAKAYDAKALEIYGEHALTNKKILERKLSKIK